MSNKNTSGIEINENGDTTLYESQQDRERRIRKARLETIRESITDENYDPAEASRLIAVEIARVAEDLSDCLGTGGLETLRLKVHEQQLRALRELGKQLNDADSLSKRDFLNFDGPKFAFVLATIVDLFDKSMKEAGLGDDMRNSIMKHYRDKMTIAEAQIRKDTMKMEGSKQ